MEPSGKVMSSLLKAIVPTKFSSSSLTVDKVLEIVGMIRGLYNRNMRKTIKGE